MVKQITIIQVNDTIVEPESTPEQVEDIIKVEEDEPQPEDDIIKDKDEINTVEKVDEQPKKVKNTNVKQYANYRTSNNTSSMPSLR
jgi:hypothetical protein